MSDIELLYEKMRLNYYQEKALSMMDIFKFNGNVLFYKWINQFEFVADKVKVPDSKMIQFFEKMVDNDFYSYFKRKLNSVNFSTLSYEKLMDHYLRYFAPLHENDVYRSRFLFRDQYDTESVEKYAYHLRKLYDKCDNTQQLEDELCEKFFKGIQDDEMKTYLRNYSGLTFDEIVKIAIDFEKVNDISQYLEKATSMITEYNADHLFYKWLNKFEFVANAVEVPDMKMIKFFNKMVRKDVHKYVKEVNSTVNFSKLTYDQMIDYYLSYFAPSYEIDLHKDRFKYRYQYTQESIEMYANNLKKIYNKCKDKSHLEEELCQQFFCGLRDDDLKFHLYKTSDLTSYDKIVKVAIEFLKDNDLSTYIIRARTMIRVYNPNKEIVFCSWLNKFEFVADYVGVPKTKMIKFFNEMVYKDVHKYVKEINSTVNFSELPYEELINYYLRYFSSSCEGDFNISRFQCRTQFENESIEKYAESLRKIHNKCVGLSNWEEELCRQFINGIKEDIVRTYLSNMRNLSYDEIVAFAILFTKEINSLRGE